MKTSMRCACSCALLWLCATSALAQERLSRSESMRSVVTPALVWRFDAGSSITLQPSAPALVTLPHLGATVGVPGIVIPWRGLELSMNVADFVVAPSPPAFGWAPQLALTQRLSPSPSYPVTEEVRDVLELALRVQVGVDPIVDKPFRVGGALPLVLRAASALRVDLTPGITYQTVYKRGLFEAPLRVLLQPFDRLFIAAVSGVSIDLRDAHSTAVALGGQLGLTVPGDFGPLADLIVEAGFPALITPARSDHTVNTDQFRIMATVRVFTFWDLNATDPDQSGTDEQQRRRCGEIP